MADIAGVSFPIAQPILNSGVNPLSESDNKNSADALRATTAPQNTQPVNPEPSDIPVEQSVSSRLDISIKPGENNTQQGDRSQNTVEITAGDKTATVTREQVVDAVDRQLQRNAVEQAAQNSSDNRGGVDNATIIRASVATSDSAEEARDTAFSLAETNQNAQNAQFAFDQIEQANQSSDSNNDSSDSANLAEFNQSFAEIGQDATQQQVRNEFIASRDPEQSLGLSVDTRT